MQSLKTMTRQLRRGIFSTHLAGAAKTALAVAIAWVIAPHTPGVTDEYPYYAPLGVLVSMHPTLMQSAKSSVQTIFSLATGMAIALLVVFTVGPTWWSVPLVAGTGVLIAGARWFGEGRDYVPIAAVLVVAIGGQHSDEFSLGYLVQMAVGIVVGLSVNFLIAPRTLTAVAAARVDLFREQLARHLHEVGDALSASWPPERDGWARDSASLADTSRSVREALDEADTSRKGNPRAIRGRHGTAGVHRQLETLELIAVRIRDVSESLADAIWERPGGLVLNPATAEPMSAACHRVADCISRLDDDDADAHRARAQAAGAVRILIVAVNAVTVSSGQAMGPAVITCMHLRRMLLLLQGHMSADARHAAAAAK